MTGHFEATVLAEPAAISGLTDRIMKHLDADGVDPRAVHDVGLAVEEILTNLGTHGNCANIPATVRLFVCPTMVKVEIVDAGPTFDPRETPDPALGDGAGQRQIGGLGLFLVRNLVSTIDYVRTDETNYTSFAVPRYSAKVT